MRLVAWNCNMALHRKADALLRLNPDVAVISECAEPDILRLRGDADWIEAEPVWVGQNPNKGLAVFTFNGFAAHLDNAYLRTLRYIAPVHITGRQKFNLLAVWAQNASAGMTRKRQAGPLRRALTKYKDFMSAENVAIAGDFNNNVIWDKPGRLMNHQAIVAKLGEQGLASAYHETTGEPQGEETVPTHYWRDRRKDGPTYHIDYIFLPRPWCGALRHFSVGSFEEWCGSGLSDHVPIVVDVRI